MAVAEVTDPVVPGPLSTVEAEVPTRRSRVRLRAAARAAADVAGRAAEVAADAAPAVASAVLNIGAEILDNWP